VSMKKDLKCDCFSKKNNQLCLLRILMIPSKCNFDKGVSVVVPFFDDCVRLGVVKVNTLLEVIIVNISKI